MHRKRPLRVTLIQQEMTKVEMQPYENSIKAEGKGYSENSMHR